MKFLIMKAAELVGGLSKTKRIYLYLRTSGKCIPGYTNDLLIVDFLDNIRKVYRYSIIREQFEYAGTVPKFLPVTISNWISRKKSKLKCR